MKKLFKKIFPLYYKIKKHFIEETDVKLTDDESVDLAVYYVIGKSYLLIVALTILTWELLKYLYK